MSGYTKQHRDRFSHPLFSQGPWCRGYAWDWMVAQAAWKRGRVEVKGKFVTLERGQLTFSVRFMAEKFGWSKSQVGRFLTRLKTESMIGTDDGTGQLIITICNYDKYQVHEIEAGTASGTEVGTGAGQERDKEEEGKEVKEEDNIKQQPSNQDSARELEIAAVAQIDPHELANRLHDAGGVALNRTVGAFEAVTEPLAWIEGGADLEMDVLQTIRSICAQKRPGSINSWSYFRAAVADSFRNRRDALEQFRKPSPTAVPNQDSMMAYFDRFPTPTHVLPVE